MLLDITSVTNHCSYTDSNRAGEPEGTPGLSTNPGLDDSSLLSSSPTGFYKEWSCFSVVTFKINVNDTLQKI